MQRVTDSLVVGAPPTDVFALLTDLEALPTWQEGVVRTEVTSEPPLAVGSTAIVTREVMGQRVDAPITVSAYEPPRRLAITTTVKGLRAIADLELAPANGGTRIDFSMEISASGLARFMESRIASAARAEVADSLKRLRERFGAG